MLIAGVKYFALVVILMSVMIWQLMHFTLFLQTILKLQQNNDSTVSTVYLRRVSVQLIEWPNILPAYVHLETFSILRGSFTNFTASFVIHCIVVACKRFSDVCLLAFGCSCTHG